MICNFSSLTCCGGGVDGAEAGISSLAVMVVANGHFQWYTTKALTPTGGAVNKLAKSTQVNLFLTLVKVNAGCF